jgi:hypothetical protein
MKNEPQIFTRTDDQSVPVDDAILGALEQEELSESLVREYIRGMLIEATEYDEQFGRLLDSDTPEQAIELSDALGIPMKDLPWTKGRFYKVLNSQLGSREDINQGSRGAIGIDDRKTTDRWAKIRRDLFTKIGFGSSESEQRRLDRWFSAGTNNNTLLGPTE